MIHAFLKFLGLFPVRYKIRVIGLFFSSLFCGLMEIVGVSLIFPFMIVIRNPDVIKQNEYFSEILSFLGLSSPNHMIYLMAGLMGGVFVFKNLYNTAHLYFEFGFIMRWKNYVVKTLMQKYLRMPYADHLKRESADIMSTLKYEVEFAFQNFIMQFGIMFSNLMILLCLLGLVLYLFFIPALIAGSILAGLMALQIFLVRKISAQVDKNYMSTKHLNLSILQKSILAIKETKTFLKEEKFIQDYDTINQKLAHHDRLFMFVRYFPTNVTEIVLILSILIMACLILIGGNENTQENMTHLAILALAAFRIAPAINRILYAYSRIKSSENALNIVCNELSVEEVNFEDITDQPRQEFKEHLKLNNVSFAYEDDKHSAISKINLIIKKGEFIGIIGASGSGKTTLANILMGLLFAKNGKLLIDETPLTKNNLRSYRANIGYVSQHPYLSSDSVKKNIAFGVNDDEIDEHRVKQVLKEVDMLDFFMKKSDGLDTTLGENGKNLSGGQRQRIAIARALYINPSILILDEATSALDVETEKKVSDAINGLKGEKTIIAIAHRLSTLKQCDRIIYMKDGQIFDEGSFNALNKKHAEFRKLIELSNIEMDKEGK